MRRKKILLFWSGGKDSALSLFELKCPEWEVVGLVSCFVKTANGLRLQMHDLPAELIQAQAESLELPLHEIILPESPSNEVYENAIAEKAPDWIAQGIKAVAFGDLFLEDIKNYRDALFSKLKLQTVYPIWGWKSDLVVKAFAGLGHQGLIHCLDSKKLPPAFLGRPYNASTIEDFPRGVDACGENGEFHTFVFEGPFFQKKIQFQTGERYEKNNFQYQELLLNSEKQARHN